MFELGVAGDAGDGHIVILHAERTFAFDAEVRHEPVAEPALDDTEVDIVRMSVGVADRAVDADGRGLRLGEARQDAQRSGGGSGRDKVLHDLRTPTNKQPRSPSRGRRQTRRQRVGSPACERQPACVLPWTQCPLTAG
jgi:hypothetical protein